LRFTESSDYIFRSREIVLS